MSSTDYTKELTDDDFIKELIEKVCAENKELKEKIAEMKNWEAMAFEYQKAVDAYWAEKKKRREAEDKLAKIKARLDKAPCARATGAGSGLIKNIYEILEE